MAGLGFPVTHWTLIVRAQSSETEKRQALDEIASNYRLPLVRYARARGLGTDRAEDLVQSLFVRLISNDFVARLDPQRGHLRGFLKTSLDHELLHQLERERAQRRGGGSVAQSIDDLEAGDEPSGGERPDQVYEREWAHAVAARALTNLRNEAGQGALRERFSVIERFFSEENPMTYAEAAHLARITVAQFKVTLHRARRRFDELLRQEIAVTVDDPGDLGSEEVTVKAGLRA